MSARQTMKVAVSYEVPPGPADAFYAAYDDNRYDPSNERPSPVGTGATEKEAIEALVEASGWEGEVVVVKRYDCPEPDEGSAPAGP